ncbi:MAG: PAS domain S-box protein [Dehalococcoidales bacterium]|nr:PAS domain S-box protein [Dehalococcoidales bacterium]
MSNFLQISADNSLYSLIVDNSRDGVIVIDNGLVIFSNEQMLRMTGYTLEEGIGQPFDKFVAPEYLDDVRKNYSDRIAGKQSPQRYDTAFISKNGEIIHVEVNASIIEYQGRTLDMAIIRDQTERISLENSLIENEVFLNNIIEQTPNPMWVSDIEGTVIRINPALKNMLHVTDESIIGKYNVFEDRQVRDQGFLDLVRSVYRDGKTVNFIIDYHTGVMDLPGIDSDTHKILEIVLSPILDASGNLVNVICQERDITEQKQYEQALIASETQYRSLFDNSFDAIFLSDPDGTIISANATACRLFGATEEDLKELGRDGITDRTDPRLPIALEQRQKTGTFVGILTYIKKDGTKFEGEIASSLFSDSLGNYRTCNIIRDITERNNLELSLYRTNRILKIISQCNQVLVHSSDEQSLLTDICKVIVTEGGYRLAWVGLKQDDAAKSILAAAQYGPEQGYLDGINSTWADTKKGKGPTGAAIRTGEICVIDDSSVDDRLGSFKPKALKHNLHSVISLPLRNRGNILGALTIYAGEKAAFTKEEIDLLSELSDDLAFGIITLRDRKVKEEAEETIRFFDAALRSIRDCVYALDTDFRIIYWNEQCESVFGIPSVQARGNLIDDVIKWIEDYPGQNTDLINTLIKQRYNREEVQIQSPNGIIWMDMLVQAITQDGKDYGWITIATDITAQKQSGKRQQLMVDILRSLNSTDSRQKILDSLVSHIKEYSQVDAIGIRLIDSGDYPYVAHSGFFDGHIESENRLRIYDRDGNPLRNDAGVPLLDCMCGKVILGDTNPEKPYFTPAGSYWTNSLSELLASVPNEERLSWSRTACLNEGYESIAIIPVRTPTETIGVLQLADASKNVFNADVIEFYENLGASIGIAFDRAIAQEELVREKNRIETIFNTARTVILLVDMEMNVLECNPYLTEITGYSLEEIAGNNAFALLVREDDRNRYREIFESCFCGNVQQGNIEQIIAKDGTALRILWYLSLVFDEAGTPVGMLCTGQDVTERLQFEELYSTVTTKTPIGVYIIQNKSFVFINEELKKLCGYFNDELIHVSPDQLIHPDDIDYVRQESIAMIKGKRSTPYEYRIIHKTGMIRWSMETVTSITYEGKKATLGCVMDITEIKNAEDSLRQSEEKLRAIIESIPQGIIVTDLNGTILQANIAAMMLYGFNTDVELIGRNALDFAAARHHDSILDKINEARDKDKPVTFDYTAMKHDGGHFPAEMSIAYIRDSVGNPTGIIGVFENISERLKMQEQLVVTDRLASVGELAAGIAHELNNPLTGVVGFSDLLLSRDNIPEDIREDLEIINREAIRTSQIARHLLTFARKHPDTKSRVNINDLITTVLELRHYEQNVNNIQSVVNLEDNLPDVFVNDFQIQQVLINIIINAEYFMLESHGNGTLTITTESHDNLVRIIIEDTGPGISQVDLPNIFNPFYTTKEVGQGTGLGLSICYGIITEHGGTIKAESEPGTGARFTIKLPVYHENAQ